jgi:hypothetical protein
MPKTWSWRGIPLALVGAVAVCGLTPVSAPAETLVARFAGNLGDQQPAGVVAQRVAVVHPARGQTTWVGFASQEPGPARFAHADSWPPARKALLLRQALQNRAALAALILMVGDIPQMPPLDTPVPLLTVPPDHGRVNVPVETNTPPPPTAPEPAAWLLALLGIGGVGGYALLRRGTGLLAVCVV